MAERDSDTPRTPAADGAATRAQVGLCLSCRHVRTVQTSRGSRFYRCGLAETDPTFARYPRLPVLRCTGYAPIAA